MTTIKAVVFDIGGVIGMLPSISVVDGALTHSTLSQRHSRSHVQEAERKLSTS
jgi:hypothetical protein